MTTDCTDARMSELLGSYLLGACPDDEADAVRDHVAGCVACTREAAQLVVARDALLTITPESPAPPELKERVMAQVRADANLFAAADGQRADLPPAGRGADRPASRWRNWLRSPVPLAAAASCAAVLLIAGALLGSTLSGDDGSAAPARTQLGAVDSSQAPGGRARIVFDDSGTARLVVTGLPNPGRERVYQVWLRNGEGDPVPTRALFSVLEDGSGETVVPGDVGSADQVLVTSEPDGGSKAPTRAPLIAVDV